MKGMEYGKTFTSCFRDLRKEMMAIAKKQAVQDKKALKRAMKNHPVPVLNHHGQRQWNGSIAQALLQYDMSLERHKERMKPHELRMTRVEYHQANTSVDQFCWKIQQEI
jgi:hypothetical protein